MDIDIRYEKMNNKLLLDYEYLRMEAYGLNQSDSNINKTYSIMISMNKFMVVGLYLKGVLVTGCYISSNKDYIIIEQLFVKPFFHNSGLKLGRLLLQDILNNKEELLKFFGKEFELAKLFRRDEKSESIYKKMGFENVSGSMLMQKKI